MQTVFYKTLTDLVRLLLPVLPHTAEEVWEYLPHETAEFAYLTDMPEVEDLGDTTALFDHWAVFMKLRDAVNKVLEEAREADLIGKNAEAALTMYLTAEQKNWLAELHADVIFCSSSRAVRAQVRNCKRPAIAATGKVPALKAVAS